VKQTNVIVVPPVYFFLTGILVWNKRGFWNSNNLSSAQRSTQNHKPIPTLTTVELFGKQ